MALLSIQNLSVTYSNNGMSVYAVRNAGFDVCEGRSVGIVGESGSGKSTLVHAVLRILNPKTSRIDGSVIFDGADILQMNPADLADIRWRKLAVVFQKSMNALSPVHKVGAFMGDIYNTREPGTSKAAAKARVKEVLEMVSLPERVANLYPHEMSGGMTQRVSIALSLMFNPQLLIMDEATTALDVVTQTQILGEIKELEKKLGLTRMMVTHDMSVVASTCDEVAVMYAGKLLEFGPVLTTLVEPAHPYTKLLLQSFPSVNSDGEKELSGIGGSLPDMREPPRGCVFAPRCPYAQDICRTEEPANKTIGERHSAACHLI